MQYEALANLVESSLVFLSGISFVSFNPSIKYLIYAYLVGTLVSFPITIRSINGLIKAKYIKLDVLAKITKLALPIAISPIITLILTSTDIVMLGWLKGSNEVGFYTTGLRLVNFLFIIPATLTTVLLPILSKFSQEKEKLINIVKRLIRISSMLAIPILLGGIVTAQKVILVIFGEQYTQSITSFQILLFLVPLIFIIIILDTLLFALNLQLKKLQFSAFSALLNLVLNFMLIREFSLYGAAIGTVLSQIVNLILTARLSYLILKNNFFEIKSHYQYLISAILISIFAYYSSNIGLNIFLVATFSAVSYFIILILMKEKELKTLLAEAITLLTK